MSLIRLAQEILRGWRTEHLAVDVVYRRTEATALSIKATQAMTDVTLDNGESITKTKVADWLIDVEYLTSEPLKGDQIDFDGFRYVVADLGAEHCWRWHGSQKRTYRVHTKQVPIAEVV